MLPSIALVVFLVAASIGLYMATRMLRDQGVSTTVVHTHGIAAAVGIGLLLYALVQNQIENRGTLALVLFLVTAAGGLVLHQLAKKLTNKPKGFALGHGAFGIFAIAMLITYLLYP